MKKFTWFFLPATVMLIAFSSINNGCQQNQKQSVLMQDTVNMLRDSLQAMKSKQLAWGEITYTIKKQGNAALQFQQSKGGGGARYFSDSAAGVFTYTNTWPVSAVIPAGTPISVPVNGTVIPSTAWLQMPPPPNPYVTGVDAGTILNPQPGVWNNMNYTAGPYTTDRQLQPGDTINLVFQWLAPY